MLIRDIRESRFFTAADGSWLCELLHPDRESTRPAIHYSLACAVLPPGKATLPHRLKGCSEVYFILAGEGTIHINKETSRVRPWQAVYIPPGASQFIENTGKSELRFLCIVEPAWQREAECPGT